MGVKLAVYCIIILNEAPNLSKGRTIIRCALQFFDYIPDCVPPWRDSEAYKTLAKREVGAILNRRHINKYVEDQNREIPPRRDSKAFKAAAGIYCTIWV